MGALTEIEIFDCLVTNFRLAAEHCDELAVNPVKGPTYVKLREELKLIEGASQQASTWREDTRWLQIGLMMGEVHKRAGDWLRMRAPTVLFTKLAESLRIGLAGAIQLRDAATGRRGMILPEMQRAPTPQNRPVQVRTPGGLILPPGYAGA